MALPVGLGLNPSSAKQLALQRPYSFVCPMVLHSAWWITPSISAFQSRSRLEPAAAVFVNPPGISS
jgi:hypothetical protein